MVKGDNDFLLMDWFTISKRKFRKIRKSDIAQSDSADVENFCEFVLEILHNDLKNVQPVWIIIFICLFMQSIIHAIAGLISDSSSTDSEWPLHFIGSHC